MKKRKSKIDEITKSKVKGLLLKGFSNDEVANLLKIPNQDVKEIGQGITNMPLNENTAELYAELQKDLSKLVITEMNKEGRDSNVVLNAIKLQVDIQEKKLGLSKGRIDAGKMSKDYIYERDDKMHELFKDGMSKKEIAERFEVSPLTVEHALDRVSLSLPSELKTLSPSIIAETAMDGISKSGRIKVLWKAYEGKLTRNQVRELMAKMKSDLRKT